MKREDNDYLTQVEHGTPMGDWLRSQWVPVMRAARVEAGGAPVRARLFGENYVVFRAEDGRVGMIDEACPHRGASMALGRVEGCALRCLYHGWEVDVSGAFVHAVSEANGREKGPNLSLKPYPVRETGNMIWAYLGDSDEAPRFPDYEWTTSPTARPHGALVHCHWLQAVEGAIDPVHVGYLHPNWLPDMVTQMMHKSAIEYEVVDQPWGFTGAATRVMPGMPGFARVKEFALPWYSHIPHDPFEERWVIFAVPIDREHCYLWYLAWDSTDPRPQVLPPASPIGLKGKPDDVDDFQFGIDARLTHAPNPDNFRETMPFDPDRLWAQDRAAMLAGEHFSGLPGLTLEDVAVMESQGPVLDRSKERLTRGDVLIVTARRMLMERAQAFAAGEPIVGDAIDYPAIRSAMGFVQPGQSWRDVPRHTWEVPGVEVERPMEPAE